MENSPSEYQEKPIAVRLRSHSKRRRLLWRAGLMSLAPAQLSLQNTSPGKKSSASLCSAFRRCKVTAGILGSEVLFFPSSFLFVLFFFCIFTKTWPEWTFWAAGKLSNRTSEQMRKASSIFSPSVISFLKFSSTMSKATARCGGLLFSWFKHRPALVIFALFTCTCAATQSGQNSGIPRVFLPYKNVIKNVYLSMWNTTTLLVKARLKLEKFRADRLWDRNNRSVIAPLTPFLTWDVTDLNFLRSRMCQMCVLVFSCGFPHHWFGHAEHKSQHVTTWPLQ